MNRLAGHLDGASFDVLRDSIWVMENARQVFVAQNKIDEFADLQTELTLVVPEWERRYHFVGNEEDTVAYLLILAAMNFGACQPKAWLYQRGDERLDGYFAVSHALKMAMENGIPLGCADFLGQMTLGQLRDIFPGTGELPFFDRRVEMFHEVAKVLEDHFGGKAIGLIGQANHSAMSLLNLVADYFPSFSDVASYGGKRVAFYKRAQIFVGDLFGTFEGQGCGHFFDIERMTAFADDSLPFILRKMGLLCYADSLARKVDGRVEIAAGSMEEVEIRAGSIVAIERVRRALADRGIIRNSVQLDWIFWNLSYDGAAGERHLSYSTAY